MCPFLLHTADLCAVKAEDYGTDAACACVNCHQILVDAILAALRGKYLDVLITDEDTAQALLERS